MGNQTIAANLKPCGRARRFAVDIAKVMNLIWALVEQDWRIESYVGRAGRSDSLPIPGVVP